MRFGCASSSSQLLIVPSVLRNGKKRLSSVPSVHGRCSSNDRKKPGKPQRASKHERMNARASSKPPNYEAIVMSKKKDQMKKNVAKTQASQINRTEYSFVYVGNIESSITKERLESWFAPCGTILRTQFRISRGKAITVGVPVPKEVRTSRDRQYATIEFKDSKAARRALELNGKRLDGCRLVVSVSPADLPEVQDIVSFRLTNPLESHGQSLRQAMHRLRSVPVERTEQAIDAGGTPDRLRFFGFSFAKCIA